MNEATINESFSQEAQEEARDLIENYELSQDGDLSRLDLTNLKTYTIDDEFTDEIDDAISLETKENENTWGRIGME